MKRYFMFYKMLMLGFIGLLILVYQYDALAGCPDPEQVAEFEITVQRRAKEFVTDGENTPSFELSSTDQAIDLQRMLFGKKSSGRSVQRAGTDQKLDIYRANGSQIKNGFPERAKFKPGDRLVDVKNQELATVNEKGEIVPTSSKVKLDKYGNVVSSDGTAIDYSIIPADESVVVSVFDTPLGVRDVRVLRGENISRLPYLQAEQLRLFNKMLRKKFKGKMSREPVVDSERAIWNDVKDFLDENGLVELVRDTSGNVDYNATLDNFIRKINEINQDIADYYVKEKNGTISRNPIADLRPFINKMNPLFAEFFRTIRLDVTKIDGATGRITEVSGQRSLSRVRPCDLQRVTYSDIVENGGAKAKRIRSSSVSDLSYDEQLEYTNIFGLRKPAPPYKESDVRAFFTRLLKGQKSAKYEITFEVKNGVSVSGLVKGLQVSDAGKASGFLATFLKITEANIYKTEEGPIVMVMENGEAISSAFIRPEGGGVYAFKFTSGINQNIRVYFSADFKPGGKGSKITIRDAVRTTSKEEKGRIIQQLQNDIANGR